MINTSPDADKPIQLYSFATPNGQKASIALEEMGIKYDLHLINIMEGDQNSAEYKKISPNSKIPAIIDPAGDEGKPLYIMESGAILMYLADSQHKAEVTQDTPHSQHFFPKATVERSRVLQWLLFQVGHAGPMFGQFGHFFAHAGNPGDHPYAVDRYLTETQRLLGVMDHQLEHNNFIANDAYSIADMALMPWVDCLDKFYNAGEELQLHKYTHVMRWKDALLQRPAVQKGMNIYQEYM